MKSYKIVIIGSGNVGYQMAWHLHNAGHQIIQVFSRHLPSAKWIGNLMDIPCTDSYSEISQEADIYLVTVKDDAISDVAEQLKLNEQVIAHTSGSVPGSVLKNVSDNFGIFYPLQTLSRNVSVDFST
ncbi:MAG: NAD(P)-binding domain-containing protein, partial [Chitinophagales bacterium]|nr:NAD(P)-binding domain-containing protein [Chitinophagales bacterium]